MSGKNYTKASMYYLIGNIFNKGIAFLTVPIFTRILSTADYGLVTTYNSWEGILAMILGFALHTAVRMAFVDYKKEIREFMTSITLFTLLCFGGAVAVVGGISLFFEIDTFLIVLCMCHAVATALITDYTHYLMMQYRYRFRTVLMILPSLISVLMSIVTILFVCKTDLYLGRIIPTALTHVIFGGIIIALVLHKGRIAINWNHIKYGLSISAPLIVHGIALNVLSQSDRIMITSLADASQTGIYSLIYNFSMIATVITTAAEGVWIPWFTERMKNREIGRINTRVKDYIHIMTYAMVCLILVAPEVVKLLADESYWEGIAIIPPIVLANYIIFIYTLYVNVEHFYKKTVNISVNTIIAAVVNIALNFIFIPRYGYFAAAYTTVAAYIVSLILHVLHAKKIQPDIYPIKMFGESFIHIVFVTAWFYVFMDRWLLRWAFLVIYIIIVLLRERKLVAKFLSEIRIKMERK